MTVQEDPRGLEILTVFKGGPPRRPASSAAT